MTAATQANPQVESMFITQPMMPVELMVTISSRETTTLSSAAGSGPNMKPPRAMTTVLPLPFSYGIEFSLPVGLIMRSTQDGSAQKPFCVLTLLSAT